MRFKNPKTMATIIMTLFFVIFSLINIKIPQMTRGVAKGLSDYSLILNVDNAPAISSEVYGDASMLVRYVQLNYDDVKSSVGYHVQLDEDGAIYNDSATQITSIKEITASFIGTLTLTYGDHPNPTTNSTELVSGEMVILPELPYFFKVTSDDTITSLSEMTITYSCEEKDPSADLVDLAVNGVSLSNFDTERTYYYTLLQRDALIPEVLATPVQSWANVDVTLPETLPGLATIDITNQLAFKTYTLYLDIISADRLMIPYPDTDFERGPYVGAPTGWGYENVAVSTAKSNSGLASLELKGADENWKNYGEAWLGFDYAGGSDYPARGDILQFGAWVFANNPGDLTFEIYSKEDQGQILNDVYNVKPSEVGKWIFIRTVSSDPVSLNPNESMYCQLVVKNYTRGLAYFDDFALFRVSV